ARSAIIGVVPTEYRRAEGAPGLGPGAGRSVVPRSAFRQGCLVLSMLECARRSRARRSRASGCGRPDPARGRCEAHRERARVGSVAALAAAVTLMTACGAAPATTSPADTVRVIALVGGRAPAPPGPPPVQGGRVGGPRP